MPESLQRIGSNIVAEIDGSILTLRIDLSQSLGPSKSQKSVLIASTNGNATLPDGTRLGVNVYRKSAGEPR